MARLDGTWDVRRRGGLLPPMPGVLKIIDGDRGETRVGPARMPFEVRGLWLHYRGPFTGLVDRLEPDGDGYRGTATYLGTEIGTFELRRKGTEDRELRAARVGGSPGGDEATFS